MPMRRIRGERAKEFDNIVSILEIEPIDNAHKLLVDVT